MRILFVGGGTLGSVTPLLAVAEELGCSGGLQAAIRDAPPAPNRGELKFAATFWGTKRGPERAIVEAAGVSFRVIPAGKFRRYVDVLNITDLFVMKWAFWVSLARLLRHRPSVVVGAGSFVQVPVMWAAWVLRIPIVIHQLDVRPALANRLCAPIARAITVTFPSSAAMFGASARVIGAPVRRAVLALARRSPGEGGVRDRDQRAAKRTFGFSGDRPVLLVLGGGTGAQALNDLVAGALAELTRVADVIHVTGKGRLQNADRRTQNDRTVMTSAYKQFVLLTNHLPDALAAADLVVSRAGMGTIAELGALGKATVLVPMPDSHQEENAATLAAAGAVEVWHQRDLTPSVFAERVQALIADAPRRAALGAAFHRVFPPDAAKQLANVIRAA